MCSSRYGVSLVMLHLGEKFIL